jgi:hypothetical protein
MQFLTALSRPKSSISIARAGVATQFQLRRVPLGDIAMRDSWINHPHELYLAS